VLEHIFVVSGWFTGSHVVKAQSRSHGHTRKHETNPDGPTFMYFSISTVVAAELLYAAIWTFLAVMPLGGAYCMKLRWSISG